MQLALLNVPFDNSYNNVLRFNTREEQEDYFSSLGGALSFSPEVNFNYGNGLYTTVTYCDKSISTEELMKFNYCIAKKDSQYTYYFIINARFDRANQVILTLERDIFQSDYLNATFTPTFIKRAHLNRWVLNPDGTYSFNFDKDSDLYEGENIETKQQRLVSRTRLSIQSSQDKEIQEWLDTWIDGWVYVYLKKGKYTFYADGMSETERDYYSAQQLFDLFPQVPAGYTVACVPIYKEGQFHTIRLHDTVNDKYHTLKGLADFFEHNNDTAAVISIKVSQVPPFSIQLPSSTSADLAHTLDIPCTLPTKEIGTINSQLRCVICGKQMKNTQSGMFLLASHKGELNTQLVDLKLPKHLSANDIITNKDIIALNPKLYGKDFTKLSLTDNINSFDYDIRYINDDNAKFDYTESLTPDITRYYCRLRPAQDSIYTQSTTKNLTGLVGSTDLSIPYSTDQLEMFMANNKNFYMQKGLNAVTSLAGIGGGLTASIMPSAKEAKRLRGQANDLENIGFIEDADILRGNASSMVRTKVGERGLLAGLSIASVANDLVNTALQASNMAQAPDLLQNANGNAVQMFKINECGIYLEGYSCIRHEVEQANKYFQMAGFAYNNIDNIKSVDHIRHYYNFVQAVMGDCMITGCSQVVRMKFKEVFERGVRFWSVTDQEYLFKYGYENYEEYLSEVNDDSLQRRSG